MVKSGPAKCGGWRMQEAYQQLMEKLSSWGQEIVLLTPNLVVAIAVLVIFWMIARAVRKGVRKVMEPTSTALQIDRLVGTVTYLVVLIAGVFVALGILGMQKTVTSFLAGAGIIGLALGFAFQDLGANLISGVYMSIRQIFQTGDLIQTNGYFGNVANIDLRSTTLRTLDGQMVTIPNKQVFENPVENYTASGQRRVDLSVGVSYADDLEKAESVAREAVEGIAGRDGSKEPEVFFEEFGGSSINFVVRFWIPFGKQTDYLQARHEAVKRVKSAFDENDITIPFPIRTLDFGIEGGERFAESLSNSTITLNKSSRQHPEG